MTSVIEHHSASSLPDHLQRKVADVHRRISIVREAEDDASQRRALALRPAVLERAFAFERASETMAPAQETAP